MHKPAACVFLVCRLEFVDRKFFRIGWNPNSQDFRESALVALYVVYLHQVGRGTDISYKEPSPMIEYIEPLEVTAAKAAIVNAGVALEIANGLIDDATSPEELEVAQEMQNKADVEFESASLELIEFMLNI